MKTIINGYTVEIEIEQDTDMRAPWIENDGHGKVREVYTWAHKPAKKPGEVVIHRDRDYYHLYDLQAAQAEALRDGWGSENEPAGITKRQKAALAVQADIDYLRGWLRNEWHWLYYKCAVTSPEGEQIKEDYCGGYDDEKYATECAIAEAEHAISGHRQATQKESAEREYWAERDVVTI